MDPSKFDDLTKAIATSTSRRQAIRRISSIVAGLSLAGLVPGLASASNSACAHFCAAVFGADTAAAGQCISDAAHGKGLCSTCGSSTPASSICCTRNSGGFCSSYGDAHCPCSSQQLCCGGTCAGCPTGGVCSGTNCVCPSGQSNCSGTCMNTQSDPQNCGSCGNVCASGETCGSGACTCGSHGDCSAGESCCSGTCVNTQNDPTNCGSCGHSCDQGQTCMNGTCVTPHNRFFCFCNDGTFPSTCTAAACFNGAPPTPCPELCANHGGFNSGNGAECQVNVC